VVPVFDIKYLISELINSPQFFDDILISSTYNGYGFHNVTSGYLFHYYFGDCEERNIIPLHAHLYFDHVPVTRKSSAGPLYIRFPNMRCRFNRETYYVLSYSCQKEAHIEEVLPLALKDIKILNTLGNYIFLISLNFLN